MPGLVYSLADLTRAGSKVLAPPAALPLDARTGRELTQILVSDVKKRFATSTAPDGVRWRPLKFRRPRGGDKPLQDTGRLAASITGRHDATSVTVGTAHPGAALMNSGGVVRPKRAKFLAIPLTREAVRAGSPRRMRAAGKRKKVKNAKGAEVAKGGKKLPLFAKKIDGKWVGHFLLVKKVTVPARPFLGVSREAALAVEAALAEAAVRKWQRARG